MPSTAPLSKNDPTVLRMAAPLMVSFVMRAAFTLVDTIYAATLGDAAVAAIGLAIPFEFLMIALWVGLSTGLTSNISRAIGARQDERFTQYLTIARRLVLVLGPSFLLLGVGIWFLAPRLGLDPEVQRAFQIYGAVLIGGSAFTSFWSIIPDSIVKAHQDTRSTMWAGIWSNLANLALNTLFLFVFHWGIFGIALSTVIGRIAGLVYAISRSRWHERRRKQAWAGQSTADGLDLAPYRALLALAVPSALTFALMSGETAIVNKILAGLAHPTEAIAAYSIYYRVAIFALNPVIAIGVALLPYGARRHGRGDIAGIRRGIREGGFASLGYALLILAPLTYFFSDAIASSLGEAELTIRYAAFSLRLVPLACVVGTPFLLARPVFEGMEMGKPGLVMAVLRYLLLSGPCAVFGGWLAQRWQQPAVYGVLVALLAVAALSSMVFSAWLRRAMQDAQLALTKSAGGTAPPASRSGPGR